MNVKLLKSKMIMFGDEDFVKSITKILGTSRQTASTKLKSGKFTRDDIALISKHYCLNDEEIRKIFIEGEDNDESERSSEVVG